MTELTHAYVVSKGLAGLGWPQLRWHFFVPSSPSAYSRPFWAFSHSFKRVNGQEQGLSRPKFRTNITSTTFYWSNEVAKAAYIKGVKEKIFFFFLPRPRHMEDPQARNQVPATAVTYATAVATVNPL